MSGPTRPGGVPPDLPPEYAETEQTSTLGSLDFAFEPVPDRRHRAGPTRRRRNDGERRGLLTPLLLVGLALLLILSAYSIGRLLSGEISDTDTSSPEPDGVVIDDESTDASAGQQQSKDPDQKKYDGQVDPAAIGGASASCQSDGSVDASGRKIGYDPSYIYDGDKATAWRCDGSGAGQRVTIDLPEETTVGEVGIVPGYAKSDPVSGVDRYAENNRITEVRWLFSDGSSVTQNLDGSPTNRSLQTMRIPETDTEQVVIEILRSAPGPRDTVAISDVRIGAVAG